MGFWDWLIVPPCPVCGKSVQSGERCFCHDCRLQLQQQRFRPWHDPASTNSPVPLYTWGSYEGALRRALQKLKYERHPTIGIQLGEWLGQVWRQDSILPSPLSKPSTQKSFAVVPIPLHADKLKTRGYNQAALMAEGFCRVTGYAHRPRALQRIRPTAAQFGLSAMQRQENVQGAFHLDQQYTLHSPVLLLDDIYTTGSTVAEAVKVLTQQKIKVAGILVIARPPLTNPGSIHQFANK